MNESSGLIQPLVLLATLRNRALPAVDTSTEANTDLTYRDSGTAPHPAGRLWTFRTKSESAFTPASAQFISSPGKGKRASTIFSPRNRNV